MSQCSLTATLIYKLLGWPCASTSGNPVGKITARYTDDMANQPYIQRSLYIRVAVSYTDSSGHHSILPTGITASYTDAHGHPRSLYIRVAVSYTDSSGHTSSLPTGITASYTDAHGHPRSLYIRVAVSYTDSSGHLAACLQGLPLATQTHMATLEACI